MNSFYSDRFNKRLYLFACLIIPVCFVATLILRIILAGSIHSDLGGVEQNVIYSIQKLLYNGDIYNDPAASPFSITQYTPVYHYICGLIGFLFGLDPGTDIHALYLVGRGVNIIFNLLMMLVVFNFSSKNLNLSTQLSWILGLTTFISIFRQGFTVRPDSLMDLMLILSAYYFTGYLKERKQFRPLIIASLLSALVIFVKQSGIQMPVILIAFLIFTGDWKGLKVAFSTILVSSAALFGLMYAVYGSNFLTNVIGGVANGIDTSWFFLYVFGAGFKIKILIPAVIVLGITFYRWNIFKGDLVTRFLCFCACAMFSFAAITVLKSGSNVAYFAAFFIISLLLIAQRIEAAGQQVPGPFYLHALFIGYICAICTLNVTHQTGEVFKLEYKEASELARRENMAAETARYVQQSLGSNEYVFTNLNDESIITDSYGRRGINNILFRNALIPQLDIFKSSNVKSGVLGYNAFRDELISGKAKFIIESSSPFKFQIIPDLNEIKTKHYQLVKEIGEYRILEHRQYLKK